MLKAHISQIKLVVRSSTKVLLKTGAVVEEGAVHWDIFGLIIHALCDISDVVAIRLKDLTVGHLTMSQAASMKKLDILTSPAFKDRIVGKAKGIGIYNYMIGEPKKCCFSLAVAVAVEEKKRGNEVKAILALEKAMQEMLNYIWDSLHPFDQEKVRPARRAPQRRSSTDVEESPNYTRQEHTQPAAAKHPQVGVWNERRAQVCGSLQATARKTPRVRSGQESDESGGPHHQLCIQVSCRQRMGRLQAAPRRDADHFLERITRTGGETPFDHRATAAALSGRETSTSP